jgi:hypothetical protein
VVSFTLQPLHPRERTPSTHWIGGWVGPRAGLDNVEKRKFLTLPGIEHYSFMASRVSETQCTRIDGPIWEATLYIRMQPISRFYPAPGDRSFIKKKINTGRTHHTLHAIPRKDHPRLRCAKAFRMNLKVLHMLEKFINSSEMQ